MALASQCIDFLGLLVSLDTDYVANQNWRLDLQNPIKITQELKSNLSLKLHSCTILRHQAYGYT